MQENTTDLISGTEEKQAINQLNQNSWSCSQLSMRLRGLYV